MGIFFFRFLGDSSFFVPALKLKVIKEVKGTDKKAIPFS